MDIISLAGRSPKVINRGHEVARIEVREGSIVVVHRNHVMQVRSEHEAVLRLQGVADAETLAA